VREQKISFLAYIVAFIFLGFSIQYKIFYIFSMLIFAFALLYDISLFFKKSHGEYWEKFIYITFSVLAYFSYIHAEAFAKLSIYMETGVRTESFETALAYFKGIYFVPSIILATSFLIAGLIFILLILSVIPLYTDLIFRNNDTVKSIKKKTIHILLFLISSLILVVSFVKDSSKLFESFFGNQFVASGILKYEFVPNRSCTNIQKDTLIKLLDADDVLVSNIKQLPFWSIPEDENATFTLKKCKH